MTIDRDFLTASQAAVYLQVNVQTVRRLVQQGKLQATKLGSDPRCHLRISAASIEKFLQANKGNYILNSRCRLSAALSPSRQ